MKKKDHFIPNFLSFSHLNWLERLDEIKSIIKSIESEFNSVVLIRIDFEHEENRSFFSTSIKKSTVSELFKIKSLMCLFRKCTIK